jgi:hypothetical protein
MPLTGIVAASADQAARAAQTDALREFAEHVRSGAAEAVRAAPPNQSRAEIEILVPQMTIVALAGLQYLGIDSAPVLVPVAALRCPPSSDSARSSLDWHSPLTPARARQH